VSSAGGPVSEASGGEAAANGAGPPSLPQIARRGRFGGGGVSSAGGPARVLRIVGWIAAAAALALAWRAYRSPDFLGEWMSLLSACFA